jgi:hypothetical protein
MKKTIFAFSTLLGLGASLPGSGSAQLPQATAAALGLGFNMTASARGFAAVANNPAGLAHPASPGFSLAIPAIAIQTGLGPVELGDFADWQGELLTDPVKAEWLQRIVDSGGQSGTVGAGAAGLALSVGPVGVQVGAIVAGEVRLTPDAAELLLYGNAGRTGSPGDFELEGSAIDGFALSTVAVSFGMRASERLFLGATGTYAIGQGLIVARDLGSSVDSDPLGITLQFPVLAPDFENAGFDQGSGVGLDVGALWEGPTLTLGATVQNVFHTFEWKLDEHVYRPGEALFTQGVSSSDFDEQPATAAPQSLLDVVADRGIEPVLSVGAEWRPSSLLSIQGDVRKRVTGGLDIGPELHAGAGVEMRAIPFLPLRAHVAVMTGGAQVGGGASLVLGPVNLSGAGAYRTGDGNSSVLGMFSLSFGAS